MSEELSGPEFADRAAQGEAVLEEQSLSLVREADLPSDWLATTLGCYSTEADYYELAQYGHIGPLKERIDEFAADELMSTGGDAVLDVGVGDGHRLARICALLADRSGRRPQMYGIELSDRMIQRARGHGVIVLKQDMRLGIPDVGRDLDGVLFLSGDLGFLMDPVDGPALRRQAVDSAYDRLRTGGKVILELVSRDPRVPPDGADVFYFSRVPTIAASRDEATVRGPETWQYIKTFTRPETLALVESSRFDAARATIRYVVRSSPDLDRIGQYVPDDDITPEESYRLLVSLTR